MEEFKPTEDEKFIQNVNDEVDVRIGAKSNSDKEKTRENEDLEKPRSASLWTRAKVTYVDLNS